MTRAVHSRSLLVRTVRAVGAYAALNVAFYLWNPLQSPWHYRTHDPQPVRIEQPGDERLTVPEIVSVLDAIDLAYGGREPTATESLVRKGLVAASIAMLPATVAIVASEFAGYLGPATDEQRAYTISVKERYNHLARLAVARGHRDDRRLFVVDAHLGKTPGPSLRELAD